MNLCPKEVFSITTVLNAIEIQQRLNENIVPCDEGFIARHLFSNQYFDGVVNQNRFIIKRNIYYRNSFLPKIAGSIKPFENHSNIYIKMRPATGYYVFYTYVTIMLFLAMVFTIFVVVFNFNSLLLIMYVLPIISYASMMVMFKYESAKAKRFLINLLNASLINTHAKTSSY